MLEQTAAPASTALAHTGRLCVVIGRTRHKMMQIEIQEAAKRGANFIELRLDFLAKAPDYKRLLAEKPCPMIATVRRPVDGGRFSGTEDERLTLIRQAIVSGFDWVDIETDVIDQIRRFKDVKRIVSYHNMREMPADLEKIHAKMCKQDAEVVKLAVAAHEATDNLRVLNLVRGAPKPTVAVCIGDLGLASRLLGPCFGTPFTYAAFNKERGVAPGLPSFDDLKNIYDLERVNTQTAVYGVVGDPVGHSLSPLIHNKAFRKRGINALYLPFRVSRGELPGFVKALDRIPIRGYSVTIPHKEAAAALASEREPSVAQIMACNTLLKTGTGWAARNTDGQAALDSILANLPPEADGSPGTLHSRSVLLLGAGGVAKAIGQAIRKHVGLLLIANRTQEKAHKLAEQLDCRAIDWAARHNVLSDLIINCTSVGMHPNTDETPVHHSYLKPGIVVMDTIYTPETTLLVKEARSRGCHVLTGVDMFVRQAALQFKLFTGQEPPIDYMRNVIRRALSPVTIKEEEGTGDGGQG
jgi:3-dehydroquinate dehydratase/shikimate dehydrogenase